MARIMRGVAMRVARLFLFPALALSGGAVQAQQISADRPGVGSSPEVVPQFTLQAEIGTDAREARLGVLPGVEIDRDESSWGAKLALVDKAKLKIAFKASYDNDLHAVLEIPANYTINTLVGVQATVIWSRSMQTYAAGLNLTPTSRLTLSPMLYYESGARAAFFVAWVLPEHDNWQVDLGYDQHRVSFGISTALDFAKLAGKR